MPPDKSKNKGKKNTFSPLDETEIPAPAEDHGQEFSNSSTDSQFSTDSAILREIAESMRHFRIDFEQYKKGNDERAKLFEDKLDELSGLGSKSPPPNTNVPSQAGPAQNGSFHDTTQSSSSAPNVTPNHFGGTPQAQSGQNHAHNFARQNNFPGTQSTMPHGNSGSHNNFPHTQNHPFKTTSNSTPPPAFTFSTPFGQPTSNPYAQTFSNPQNRTANSTVPPAHPFAAHFSGTTPASAPPLQRNFRPNNFTQPTGIVLFDRTTWFNSTKHSTCANERFETVHAWYDDIKGCMSASTGHKNVLPDLDRLNAKYDFRAAILPPVVQNNYNWANEEYNNMSSALRVYFFRANTFSEKCTNILLERKTHSSVTCGFTLLLKLLSAIFPHMGCKPVDVNAKLAKITFNKGETYDSFYERFLDIEKEVELSLHKVSNTSVVETFMTLLMKIECVVPRLSTIFVELNTHIEQQGPNVDFRFSLEAIYRYLKSSGIDTKSEIPVPQALLPNGPQAFAAIVSTEAAKLIPNDTARRTDSLTPRDNRCPVCTLRHDPLRCWVRGSKFVPLWLRRSISKYNALHPNDEPDSKVINADPPIRKATVKSYNPVTKQAIVEFGSEDDEQSHEYVPMIEDPEFTSSSGPVSDSSPAATADDPNDAIPSSSTEVEKGTVGTAKQDHLIKEAQKLLDKCFHCGMADYAPNPFGNPFDDQMITDLANPLIEY